MVESMNMIDFYDIIAKIYSLLSLKEGRAIERRKKFYCGSIWQFKQRKNISASKNIWHHTSFRWSVKSEGLSILYPKNIKRNIIFLDTAGQETLLKDDKRDELFKDKTEEKKMKCYLKRPEIGNCLNCFFKAL